MKLGDITEIVLGEAMEFGDWNIAMERSTIFKNGKPTINGPFSMAIINNHRVKQNTTRTTERYDLSRRYTTYYLPDISRAYFTPPS